MISVLCRECGGTVDRNTSIQAGHHTPGQLEVGVSRRTICRDCAQKFQAVSTAGFHRGWNMTHINAVLRADMARSVPQGGPMPDSDYLHGLEAVEAEYLSMCPACGSVIDYCQGHGSTGDPEGARILEQHDNEDHSDCHPDGCTFLDDRLELVVTGIEDTGPLPSTVRVFHGLADDGRKLRFAVDHRQAAGVIETFLCAAEDHEDFSVLVEGWQILGPVSE